MRKKNYMHRILAFTDHVNTPSSRYRIRAHIQTFSQAGYFIRDHIRKYSTQSSASLFPGVRIRSSPLKFLTASYFEARNVLSTFSGVLESYSYDAVWISRELIIGYPSFEYLLNKPLIYDIDDAIFLSKVSQTGVKMLIKKSAAVIAGNSYLAAYAKQYSDNVFVVPTAVDTNKFRPHISRPSSDIFAIGWSGTSSSYKYFVPIQSSISAFCRQFPKVRLKFFSDRYPKELCELYPYIDFELWDPNLEASQIQSLDLGIMPLDLSNWSRGKCSYKMLLYASVGIPTICTPVGMNAELISNYNLGLPAISPSDWYEQLEYCYQRRDHLRGMFSHARQVVCKHFSTEQVSHDLLNVFRSSGL